MKHLKKFENISEPQIGDYVLCEDKYVINDEVKKFLKNTIGKIININDTTTPPYSIQYENIPNTISNEYFDYLDVNTTIRYMHKNEIIHCSKNKEDLEIYIESEKYNL